ncbi:MAG: hypothetical protein LBM62_01015 [Mediterranea sp.]|jgi:predicted esterase|nr:hypothetical protein [Mediterranea sp.]
MKTVKINLALLCLLCGTGTLFAQPRVKNNLVPFFRASLEGDTTAYLQSKPLKTKEIEAYRSLVWEAWKEANAHFDEERLIPTDTLSPSATGKWHLPANLEPDAVMPYYWGTKGTMATGDSVPMFLYLHGSGPKEQEWATGLYICRRFDDAPSLYFIPQIPNEGNYYRWWQQSKQFAWERLLRQALLSGNVNPNRIYLFGISEGGYGSQRLASFYADYWAAAGPMAGGEPLKNAPAENCADIGFSLRTGDKDTDFYRNTLTRYTQQAFDSLQNSHPTLYRHRIELIPDKGHAIDYTPTTPWLKQFTRNPYPTYVSWENFEMDGRYRKGFYNLAVRERSNIDPHTRTYYEMNIDGNHIALRVDEVTYHTTEKDPKWGIEMKFARTYTPAHRGKITVYLCSELVNLDKPIVVTLNGKQVFAGKVKCNLINMVNSCALFYDPNRIYPAAVEIEMGR